MKHTERLDTLLNTRRCTLLGVGPMSKNCVDAAIELANDVSAPIILIATRRQIETAESGGGYVNNWTTEAFAKYVRERDLRGNVVLARDHGGPWQNYLEVKQRMNLKDAMESSKRSYLADIQAGFDMIHIDPSIDIYKKPSFEEVLERLFELYIFCVEKARALGRDVFFEFGTDEQSEGLHDAEELEALTEEIINFCEKNRLPKPYFVVAQTGTKVKETTNVGILAKPEESRQAKAHLKKLVEICNRYGVRLKEHNADYLSDEVLRWHPEAGIHAINVAPEFGVVETRHILSICKDLNLGEERDRFLALAHASNKWDKWLLSDTKTTDYDRAVIAGHYVFSAPEFEKIKARIAAACRARGFDLDESIKQALKSAIMRYSRNLNLHDDHR
ncbi:MAG: class II D-tagatose-bisphosphate aldolase, non-catalytic subunit [Candidatus Liptonbacteria bacterium]|nr:class II D-tagatose-bisphosphate aldolase, non-catalytic subunit [Candidatus Liptonbacteria bacterium]